MANSIAVAKMITSLLKLWGIREVEIDVDDLEKEAWAIDDESASAVSWPD